MWTEAKLSELHRLASETELSLSEVADQLGASRNAVIGKINRTPEILKAYRERRPARANAARIGKPYKARPKVANLPGIHLRDLSQQACRWPLWEKREDPEFMQFCGETSRGASDYCATHHARVYDRRAAK